MFNEQFLMGETLSVFKDITTDVATTDCVVALVSLGFWVFYVSQFLCAFQLYYTLTWDMGSYGFYGVFIAWACSSSETTCLGFRPFVRALPRPLHRAVSALGSA